MRANWFTNHAARSATSPHSGTTKTRRGDLSGYIVRIAIPAYIPHISDGISR